MGITDQIRKWRRNSQPKEGFHVTTGETIAFHDNDRPQPQQIQTMNPSKKVRKSSVPKKQYPPSPDAYLKGIGDYTFIKQVGQGKFSRVILSYHYLTKQQVAIKIIDKRIHDYRVMSRLVREISLMEVLDHPNVVRLYETFETTDSLFIVMEYVEGCNLDEYLQQKGGKISEIEARGIFRQMAAAMDYCHSRWVVHRDLKAPNVLLTKDNQVKIADFGLGNRYGRRRLKTICGSMLYYSPEIINGQGYTGPEIDCWCLGVSLFRMTVGEEPFAKANTVGDLRKDVTTGNFIIPNTLSIDLRNTILKCMSIDKNKRTRVHIALDGDPWLSDNGNLPNIFTYGAQTPMASVITAKSSEEEKLNYKTEKEKMKYQHMRDMEEEKRSKKLLKKTIVCHPKNPSIYFTSSVPHSPKPEETFNNSETQRHLHFQKINDLSRQIHLLPAQHAGNKSPIRHLLRKLKQNDNASLSSLHSSYSVTNLTTPMTDTNTNTTNAPVPPREAIRKTTSNMSLTQLYQRVTKDQIHYYSFELTPHTAIRLTGVGESSVSFQPTQQDESVMMLIIRGVCDIMGITYHRDKNDRLICVMALSDYVNEKSHVTSSSSFYKLKRKDSKMVSSNQSLGNHEAHDGSQASLSRSSAGLSDVGSNHHNNNNNSGNNNNNNGSKFSNKFKRMTSHVLSSLFPYHSSTLVVHDSRSIRYPPLPQSRLSSYPRSSFRPSLDPQTPSNDNSNKKSGVALFAIDVISLSKDMQHRVAAVRLSKIDGSSKVFRIACGWITGAIGQNMTPAQLADHFDHLMMYDEPIHPNNNPSDVRRLSRPKSAMTLLPTTSSSSSSIPMK